MTKYLLYLIFFLNLSLYGQFSDTNKGVPTFYGSSTNLVFNDKLLDIYNKTQLHISNKADSIFIKRMKLKENDSIQFKLSYLIDKFGYVVRDSTKIDTGIPSFDNYIKLMIGSLPKFTPALDLITKEYRKYKISLVSEFVVKNKQLTLLESNKTPDFKEPPIFPVFESCAKDIADKTHCRINTYQTIAKHLDLSKLNLPSSITEIRFMVVFSIDEMGKVKDLKILRSPEIKGFKETVTKAFYSLPEFHVPENSSDFLKQKFTLPMTVQINGGEYKRPYRNGYGIH